jgi:D-alanine-D-alanine ligase
VLEMLGIPYSGSDPLTMAVTLDKPVAKQLVHDAGVATPRWQLVRTAGELKQLKNNAIPLPAFIKPAYEGSSKGIRLNSLAHTYSKTRAIAAALLKAYGQPVLIEQYIQGEEVTVGIVGNSPPAVAGIMRVVPRKKFKNFIYSLEVKRDWRNLVDYECPARFNKTVIRRITDSALKAFAALGCRDVSRVDFRIGQDGVPYFLEVNPLPGLNPVSGDLPIMSGKMGLSYNGLIEAIIKAAAARYKL